MLPRSTGVRNTSVTCFFQRQDRTTERAAGVTWIAETAPSFAAARAFARRAGVSAALTTRTDAGGAPDSRMAAPLPESVLADRSMHTEDEPPAVTSATLEAEGAVTRTRLIASDAWALSLACRAMPPSPRCWPVLS